MISDEEHELFKWDLLADANEDALMLYEALGWARWQFPGLTDEVRAQLAERVLRELHAEGLIAFERGGQPMTATEVESAIAGDDWRVVPLGPDGTEVRFFTTAVGEARYYAAPDHIVRAWNARTEESSR